ncbi:MAG TPA: GntR family transcriptional regulator [Ktedonobacteraceae bacterium]|nr:GntR family transcriptional regulator [Ktedonobacteraceae bacterium]
MQKERTAIQNTPASENKQERTYAILRRRIIDGTYASGYRLNIDALARELGVSKVPIREAIRRLEAEGWVVSNRNASPQVAQIDLSQWESSMTILALLEGYATALAAEHLTEADSIKLWQINADMQQALRDFDISAFNRLNRVFHSTIYVSCPNTALVELLQQTWDKLDTIRSSVFLFLPERGWASVNEHVQLIRLCEQHAPFDEIEREARLHKLRTREAYQQRVNKALAAENHEENETV